MRAEDGGRARVGTEGVQQRGAVPRLGGRLPVERRHEGPYAVVVVGALEGRDLGREDRGAVRRERHLLEDRGRFGRIRDVPEDAQAFAESLAARTEDAGVAAVDVLRVIAFVLHPEVGIDRSLELFRLRRVLLRVALMVELFGHLRKHVECTIEDGVGAEAFALGYVHGLHPARIALLAPVDERRFAAIEAGGRVECGHTVRVQAAADDVVDLPEPGVAAGLKVNLPSGGSPYLTVCAAGP